MVTNQHVVISPWKWYFNVYLCLYYILAVLTSSSTWYYLWFVKIFEVVLFTAQQSNEIVCFPIVQHNWLSSNWLSNNIFLEYVLHNCIICIYYHCILAYEFSILWMRYLACVQWRILKFLHDQVLQQRVKCTTDLSKNARNRVKFKEFLHDDDARLPQSAALRHPISATASKGYIKYFNPKVIFLLLKILIRYTMSLILPPHFWRERLSKMARQTAYVAKPPWKHGLVAARVYRGLVK